jgi:ribosomal protein S16
MKKISFGLAFFCLAAVLIFSCKHEIPVSNPGSGNGTGGSGSGSGNTGGQSTCSPDTVYFQQQVLSIFVSNCSLSGCHDAISQQHGLVLTNYNGIMAKISPGNLNNSKIWEKINDNDPSDRMPPPPRNPLSQAQKDIIKKWIQQGAKNNSCTSASCDSVNVTYSSTIKSIISAKCQGCHSSTAPANGYDFTQYAVVKARVTDGKLWGAINHLPGYFPMPKNGNKLSDCEIAQVRRWINAGAPNN